MGAILLQSEAPLDLSRLVEESPTIGLVVLLSAVGVGILLLLLGGKLAKPACAVSGLVLGCVAAWLAAGRFNLGNMLLVLVIGGGVAGCLLSVLLFRIWMGASGALILGLALPVASLVWTDKSGPSVDLQADGVEVPAVALNKDEQQLVDEETKAEWQAYLHSQWQSLRAQLDEWWTSMDDASRRTLLVSAGVGGLIGLLMGLIFPHIGASVQSSIVGATMVVLPGLALAAMAFSEPPSWLPDSPRSQLVAVGLITVIGLLLQWTLLRRRADS